MLCSSQLLGYGASESSSRILSAANSSVLCKGSRASCASFWSSPRRQSAGKNFGQCCLRDRCRCWWPNVVTTATVFQALHYERTLASKRVKMFWIAFGAIAVWEIIPQYIFPVLTGLSIFCLIDNGRSGVMRNVFGGELLHPARTPY